MCARPHTDCYRASRGDDCRGCDPDAAYDSSRACPHTTTAAPLDVPAAVTSRSSLYQPAAPVASASAPAATAPAAMISATASGGAWAIQVGAFSSQVQARAIAKGVHEALADLLTTAQIELLPTSPFGGKVVYRRASAICLPMQQTRLAPDWPPDSGPAWLSLPGRRCSQSVLRHRPVQRQCQNAGCG